MRSVYVVFFAGVLSCGGEDGAAYLAKTADAAESCQGSGTEISLGPDSNGNGVLDDSEVEDSFTVCDGSDGIDGEDRGPSMGVINKSFFCFAQLESSPIWFYYRAVVFSDGSVWANGQIADGAISASGGSFYSPSQVGAQTATVAIPLDEYGVANGGFWEIGVNHQTLSIDVRYADLDVAGGELLWHLPADHCTIVSSR